MSNSTTLTDSSISDRQLGTLIACAGIIGFYAPYVLARFVHPWSRKELVQSTELEKGTTVTVYFNKKYKKGAKIVTVIDNDFGEKSFLIEHKDWTGLKKIEEAHVRRQINNKIRWCGRKQSRHFYDWNEEDATMLRSVIGGMKYLPQNVCKEEWPEFDCICCSRKCSQMMNVTLMGWIRLVLTTLMCGFCWYEDADWTILLYFTAASMFLLIVNLGRYVLPKYVKQEAYAVALGLMWPKQNMIGNLKAHARELRMQRQQRSDAIKALKVNISKKSQLNYVEKKVFNKSEGETLDIMDDGDVKLKSARGVTCSVTILTAIAGITSYIGIWIILPILGIFDVAYTLYFGPGKLTLEVVVVDILIVVDMSFTLIYWIFHYTYKKLNPEQIPLEFSTIATKQYRLIVPFWLDFSETDRQYVTYIFKLIRKNVMEVKAMFLIREHNLNETRDMLTQVSEMHRSSENSFVKCIANVLRNVWDRHQNYSPNEIKQMKRELMVMKLINESGNDVDTSVLMSKKEQDEEDVKKNEEQQDAKTTTSTDVFIKTKKKSEFSNRTMDCIEKDFATIKFEITKFMLKKLDKLISEKEKKRSSSLLRSKRHNSSSNAYVEIDDSKIQAYVEVNYGEGVWKDAKNIHKKEIKRIVIRGGDKKQINNRIELLAAVTKSYWDHERKQIMKSTLKPDFELNRLRRRCMFHNHLLQLYFQIATQCTLKPKSKDSNVFKIKTDLVIRELLERLDMISGAETVEILREVCLQLDTAIPTSSTFQQWISELRRIQHNSETSVRVPIFEGSEVSSSIEIYLEEAETSSGSAVVRMGSMDSNHGEDKGFGTDEHRSFMNSRRFSRRFSKKMSSRKMTSEGDSVLDIYDHLMTEGKEDDEDDDDDELNEMISQELASRTPLTVVVQQLIHEIEDSLDHLLLLVDQIGRTDKLVHACRDDLENNEHQFKRALHRIEMLGDGKTNLMKIYERFKKVADQQSNINTNLIEVRDALISQLGQKINHKEYKGGLMGDNYLKIQILRKAIALIQQPDDDIATGTGTTSSNLVTPTPVTRSRSRSRISGGTPVVRKYEDAV